VLVTSRALAADRTRDERVALRGAGTVLTYRALREHAARIAAASRGWGGEERFVALLGAPTPHYVAAFLGLASAGWAVGAIDSSGTPAEIRAALDQLAPVAVITSDRDWPSTAWEGRWNVEAVDGLVADPIPATGADLTSVDPDAPFYAGFTSGSSGTPKVFVRSHRSWFASFERLQQLHPIPPGGRVVVPGPLSSSHFLFGALHGLHIGATVELGDANDWAAADAVFVVPTMLVSANRDVNKRCQTPFVDAGDFGTRRDRGPRYLFCAGAHLDPALAAATRERCPDTMLVEYYGASELSFVAVRCHGDSSPRGSVGRAFPGVEIRIIDDADDPVATGEVGEIVVRSDLVFSGYRGVVPAGAARERRGGWLGVGDRGRLDAEGYLFVAGRGSALIISGGVNVQPEEVEELVASVPGVAQCAVVGLPDPRWGELVCAVLVLDPGGAVTRSVIRGHLASRLDRGKRPRRYVVLDGPLPTGRAGKVDRSAVRELLASGRELR
jgi:long-chain acyl-CoA synthetase